MKNGINGKKSRYDLVTGSRSCLKGQYHCKEPSKRTCIDAGKSTNNGIVNLSHRNYK